MLTSICAGCGQPLMTVDVDGLCLGCRQAAEAARLGSEIRVRVELSGGTSRVVLEGVEIAFGADEEGLARFIFDEISKVAEKNYGRLVRVKHF